MEYKVVPFVPSINRKTDNPQQVSKQLEAIISNYTDQGWQYVRLESVETHITAELGCFGIGAKPGYTAYRQMIVFRNS